MLVANSWTLLDDFIHPLGRKSVTIHVTCKPSGNKTIAGMDSIRHWSNQLLWQRHYSIKAKRHICFVSAMLHTVLFLREHPLSHRK